MAGVDFGMGLLGGAGFALLCHLYYRRQLRLLTQVLNHDRSPRILGITSPFFSTLVRHQGNYTSLQRALDDAQSLLRTLPLAYLQVDQDNHLQWCNPAAQSLLNLSDLALRRPRLLLELFRSYDLDQLIEETREAQLPCRREWSLNSVGTDLNNPQPQPSLHLRGYGFPLAQGQVAVFLEDRREVVQLTQQRDRWVSDVAHELKTPLTSIRLVAETLVDRVTPPWQSWMERLLGEVIHLSHLVQDLLDLSRLDRRSPALVISNLDLVDLVNTAWDSLEPISRHRQIDLHYQGPLELTLAGDRSRLYQVLLNLLDNAIKYSPPRSIITVRVGLQEPDQVCLEVIDQGSGFPPDDLPHVFERFYRADPARTRVPMTTLGDRFVESHTLGDREPPLDYPDSPDPRHTAANPAANPAASAPEAPAAPVPDRSQPPSSTSDFATPHAAHPSPALSNSAPANPTVPIGSAPTPPLSHTLHSNSCGLGLAIVQQIILAHQGHVFAQNHPQGGAWLTLKLPRSGPELGQQPLPKRPSSA